jgi:hypothetical protein
MARLDSIIKRIDRLLSKTRPFVGKAYKRVVTKSGGDSVTGRNATVSTTDTEFSVPPAVRKVTDDDVMRIIGVTVNLVTDLIMTASPTALTASDLTNPNLIIVFKNGGYEEEFFIVSYNPAALYGGTAIVDALIRSKKRVSG